MKHVIPLLIVLAPGVALSADDEGMPSVPYNEAMLLPIRSPSLRPGPVEARPANLPGITALFLIGDDPRSHAWLQQRLPELQRLGAAGLVVNVESAAALQALRDRAPDLSLTPIPGDDLAQRLGLSRYPLLITATAIEQ